MNLSSEGDWWGKSLGGALGVAIGIWILFTVIFAGKLATIGASNTPKPI